MNIFTVTFIVLLTLKLAEVAAISWWAVFAPIIAWVVWAFAVLGLAVWARS